MVWCTYCGQEFSRAEHLDRHVLTHTNVKPYKCSICHFSFKRRDLLQRHYILVHKDTDSPGTPPSAPDAGRPIACVSCAKAKTKCDKATPTCSRCASKGLTCHPRATRRSADAAYRRAKRQLSLYKRPVSIAPRNQGQCQPSDSQTQPQSQHPQSRQPQPQPQQPHPQPPPQPRLTPQLPLSNSHLQPPHLLAPPFYSAPGFSPPFPLGPSFVGLDPPAPDFLTGDAYAWCTGLAAGGLDTAWTGCQAEDTAAGLEARWDTQAPLGKPWGTGPPSPPCSVGSPGGAWGGGLC
ncbi:hypothetical protein EJ06DRAFT_369237 [Trichodelitschia bisporula]|uniref:Zn(2)-C6 fungal-type domain-containing protein n=1 Tax=Trichodelitschia bisporula TaxID=703511 RepID=A0A6G1I0Z4_9PEZI|nr:hypothetical protein EJ06DRAFT_369237 [Trichodelitschia bisporula]